MGNPRLRLLGWFSLIFALVLVIVSAAAALRQHQVHRSGGFAVVVFILALGIFQGALRMLRSP